MSVLSYVDPNTTLIGWVDRQERVCMNDVPPLICHIIKLPNGNEIAVPNRLINLQLHLGKRIWYCSRQSPIFKGVDIRVASSTMGNPSLDPLYDEVQGRMA